jgi:Holliday junction resolvase RusA-like endonuclease
MPPSANVIWRYVQGRAIKSAAYRQWIASVASYALVKTRFELAGEVRAVYQYGRPSKRRMDVCNREKGVSDVLQAWGILRDDSQIVDIRLAWSDDVPPGMVRVTLEEC